MPAPHSFCRAQIVLAGVYGRVLHPVRELVASIVVFLPFVNGTHDEHINSVDRATP